MVISAFIELIPHWLIAVSTSAKGARHSNEQKRLDSDPTVSALLNRISQR
jgi:hypothetical protein